MHRFLRVVPFLVILTLVLSLTLVPGQAQVAHAASSISYTLFATDTYIQLADGTVLYNYGFVGGRDTDYVVYQNSMVAPPKSPKGYVPGGLVSTDPANPSGIPAVAPPCPLGTTWGVAATLPACVAQLAGNAQFPAPLIRAGVGDAVQIRLQNLGVTTKTAPNDPHSIHLHGLDVNAANDGVPETSVGAIPLNAAMPGAGNIVFYYFSPLHAGTYMYHCHQEADIHVQMGMFGALVVYEPTDAAYLSWLTTGTPTGGGTLMGAAWTKENILLLSEFDVRQHVSEQQGAGGNAAYNPVTYQPQYWSINGLSFPSTIHVAPPVVPVGTTNWFNNIWLPAHKGYDPLIVGSVGAGDKVLLRVINMGFETQPMHMHGFHGKILGSDQRAWTWAYNAAPGFGLEKNTLTIGSGETYEWLLDFGTWAAAGATSDYRNPTGNTTQTRYFNNIGTCVGTLNAPAPADRTDCPAIPDPAAVPPATYIGGPTVGPILPSPDAGTVPGALMTAGGITPFTGQLFPFHNHDDYKATNNGVYPGGMFTMIATVP
jgi:FtsP/CotA-like multicopper oxidase with cupredoxin domain